MIRHPIKNQAVVEVVSFVGGFVCALWHTPTTTSEVSAGL